MELSVLIANYNGRDHLAHCLDSLYKNTRIRPLDVVVVDNASEDGSVEMLRERFQAVRTIVSEKNLGFARANNLAMGAAKGRFHLLLNNDTLVPPGAADTMLRVLKDRPDVGVLGPLLRNEDGSVQISYGHHVGFSTEAFQKLLTGAYEAGWGFIRRTIERKSRRPAYPDWVSGACMMLRADLPPAVRRFDEAFFMYLEDVDLCHRIREHGLKVMYTPEAEIIHLGGRSVATHRERVALEYRRSQLYFYSKHHGRRKVSALKAYLLARAALGWLLADPAQRGAFRQLIQVVRNFEAGGPETS